MTVTAPQQPTHTGATSPAPTCTPAQRVTRSLLGWGVVAGPSYVVVSLAQVVAQPGFDPTRHAWSLLAAGPWGWVQSVNLVLTGAMVLAFAVGLARSTASRWAPRLVGVFGAGQVVAGLCAADPMGGYPVGVPTPATPSWHGLVHLLAGSAAFLAMVVALLVLGRTFAREGRRALAWQCRLTGVALAASIVAIASGSTHPALVIGFTLGVVAVFATVATVAVAQYRRQGPA